MTATGPTDAPRNVLRPVDPEAIRLAKTLMRTARHGTLATLEPATGHPLATRVGLATDSDGTPTILVSALSAHTPALRADPRCSLLIGEAGRGDPLAHPRITLACEGREIESGTAARARIARRYLAHQPKAALYADLPDFTYFRLEIARASLNAGFGRAFALKAAQILSDTAPELAEGEPGALAHMNDDHPEAVTLLARHYAGAPTGRWRLTGIDGDGLDFADGDDVRRAFFEDPVTTPQSLHETLLAMTRQARAALAG